MPPRPMHYFVLALLVVTSSILWTKAGVHAGNVTSRADQRQFSDRDLIDGFLALAFGSDLRVGDRGVRIRRFDRPARFFLSQRGSVERAAAYRKILEEFGTSVPGIGVVFVDDEQHADVTVLLLDERQLRPTLASTVGRALARAFYKKIEPQCLTRVQSDQSGHIRRVHSLIVVDQGEDVFVNCAYHETMHVFGLTHHSDRNPWTALNQERTVASLSEYDRLLLTLLYDEAIRPGMSPGQIKRILPALVRKVRAGNHH